MIRPHSFLRLASPLVAVILATCSLPSDLPEGRPIRPSFFQASGAAVYLVGAGDISTCSNTGDSQTAAVVQGVLSSIPTAMVYTAGDNAYPDGSAADYQNCYEPTWGQFKSKTKPSIGNHEYNTGTANPYFDYYNGAGTTSGVAGTRGQGWYSYNLGKWHLVVLNANSTFVGTKAGSTQEQWLKADLAATSQPCILAYWHHPRFTSGTTDPLPAPGGFHYDFWKDLYAAGADLVINGHHHIYERYAPQTPDGVLDMDNGLRQITAGTGGANGGDITVLRTNSEIVNGHTRGALKLTLDDGRFAWEFLPVAGQTFTDKGTGICHGSPAPAGDTPPSVSFGQSCNGLTCDFSDTSTDPDGSVVEWGWSFGDGTTSVARNPSHSYAAGGTYSVRLVARDNDGVTRSSSKQITVASAPNTPPVADFSSSCSGLTCSFTDRSTDADGTVTAWSWTFGDGASSTVQDPSHTYAAGGSYIVELTAKDNGDGTGAVSRQVSVTAPTPPPPISLTAAGRKVRGVQHADLRWSGAQSTSVDVHRGGVVITTTANDGVHDDNIGKKGAGTYVYKVCEAGTSICSNSASVVF
jgi:PKD repeat protein